MKFVPIQIVNLSLEEVKLHKHRYVGTASPTLCGIVNPGDYGVIVVQKEENIRDNSERKFEEYLEEKLAHLGRQEQKMLKSVLRKYRHIFYGIGSTDLGCTSQVQHSIVYEGHIRSFVWWQHRAVPHVIELKLRV